MKKFGQFNGNNCNGQHSRNQVVSSTSANKLKKSFKGKPNQLVEKKNADRKKNSAEEVFQKTSLQHERRAKEVLQSFDDYYISSSEEEDLNDGEIISNLLKSYRGSNLSVGDVGDQLGQQSIDGESLGSTAQYLVESCQSGAITCLVCISRIKRHNEIWSCMKCYGIFHLKCIKQWVLEGVAQATLLSDKHFPNREQPWYCPKCRNEYSRSDCPQSYFCFCGQVKNPPVDPWIVPHSCGQMCNKLIQNPVCGHHCLLLCHPGPCPPCPQMVKVGCHCGKKPPVPRRCGSGTWTCGQPCHKLLACKRHKCMSVCHEGKCTPCQQTSLQPCICGSHKKKRPCTSPQWTCDKPCGKKFSCGFHFCDKVCHEQGECGECPRSGVRTCPCGKQTFEGLSCKDDVKTCEDTCNKPLSCYGNHKCTRRCHFGECGPCPLLIRKPCRCKRNKKEVPCSKEFICEAKCSKTRSCGNHQCKHKCCKGNCPPCEQICNKLLRCRKHKCQMLCHKGPCYPCPLTSKVACHCGKTAISVVCGKAKKAKPPRCRFPCENPTNCHHEARIAHPCHFGNCPDCKQVCNKRLKCGHYCPVSCHDNVKVKNEIKPTAPWEKPQQLYEIKALDCQPCKVPVSVVCKGGHETNQFSCHEAKSYCCGRECGRKLKCGNHVCEKPCHAVKNAKDKTVAGDNCESCDRSCDKPRSPGCNHKCPSLCHKGDCPPCLKPVKLKCYCGMIVKEYLCCEWLKKSAAERESVKSCGNSCPKHLTPCGHACPNLCHAGDCPTSEICKKKISLKCPCKRIKKDFLCSVILAQKPNVVCDTKCLELKEKKETEVATKEREKREEEEKRQQEEIEKFERKMGKRPRRKKAVVTDEDIPEPLWKRAMQSSPIRASMLVIIFIVAVTVIFYRTG